VSRRVGIEFRRSYQRRIESGFVAKYLSGHHILDIGFRGGDATALPITEHAIGIDLDYPGYDGIHLPFPDESQDAVLASHILEHVTDRESVLRDWYRVVKVGGYLCIFVPHKYLYERRPALPSLWNGDHKQFYTPGSLMVEVERSLPINGFRIRHFADNDFAFDYERVPGQPPSGSYEIELVIEKIQRPAYSDYLEPSQEALKEMAEQDDYCTRLAAGLLTKESDSEIPLPQKLNYMIPWAELRIRLAASGGVAESALRRAIKKLLERVEVDTEWYRHLYPDLANVADLARHWREHGYFEGRSHRDYWLYGSSEAARPSRD
jgi:SAM-dependent methyltransferase